MKLTMPITIDVNLADWRAEYGLATDTDASTDVQESMEYAAHENWAPLALVKAWPALRGLVTITAGTAKPADDPAAAVNALIDTFGLDVVSQHIARAKNGAAEAVIADAARRAVAAQGYPDDPTPVAVMFSAFDYENGWFLYAHSAEVTFADGSTDWVEIEDETGNLNAALNPDGACGPESAMAVRLSDGTTDYADYAADIKSVVAGWLPTEKRDA